MALSQMLFGYGLLDEQLISRTEQARHWLNDDETWELARRDYPLISRSAQFIYSRLLLKTMLSRSMGVSVRSLSIRTASNGQPQLYQSGRHVEHMSLSLSHDRDRLFVAAGFRCLCGVDVQSLHGVDWPLVMRAMGWTDWVDQLLRTSHGMSDFVQLNQAKWIALLWSAYEAWMKAMACTLKPSDFVWQKITLIMDDHATKSFIFEMILGKRCPCNHARIFLSLRANEVLATATIVS